LKRLAKFIPLFAALVASSVLAVNVRFTLVRNADGTISTAYPAGDKIPVLTLACDDSAAPSLVNLVTGTAYSADVRQYFSGTGAAGATLSVRTVSGDDATAEGWGISGNNLTHAGGATGSGVLRIRGVSGGNTVDCEARPWSYIAPLPADTTAPTIPLGITTSSGAGNVTISWDASADPYTTEAGSGIEEYDVRLGSTVVTTLTSQPAGLSLPTMEAAIGASDGTPSTTQTGASWELSFGGAGIVGTADQIMTRGSDVGGDFVASVKVTSITTAATSPSAGLIARESTNADSAMYACRYAAGTVRYSARATTAATRTNSSATVVALPVYLRMERSGNTWSCDYSTDGAQWLSVGADTVLALPATVRAAGFLTSSSAGTNAVAVLDELAINNVSLRSYTHTTTTGGSYSVRARDADANNSSYSAAVTGTPGLPTDSAAPTFTAQPLCSAINSSTISCNLGTAEDPSGVEGYIPSTSTAFGGAYTDQAQQSSNLYSFTGLVSGTTRCLKSKAVDTVDNVSSYSTASCATTPSSSTGLIFQELFSPTFAIPSTNWNSSTDTGSPAFSPCSRTFGTSTERGPYIQYASTYTTYFGAHCMIVSTKAGTGTSQNFIPGVEYWVGFSSYLVEGGGSEWVNNNFAGAFDILWQMHGINGEGTANNPMFSLDAAMGEGQPYILKIIGDTTSDKPYERGPDIYTSCGNIVTNQWDDWVFNFTFGNPGVWRVYRNGTLCLNNSGLNYFVGNTKGPYTTDGTYHGQNSNYVQQPGRTKRTAQFRVGRTDQGASYATVAPRAP
jgi:hypothetical protein